MLVNKFKNKMLLAYIFFEYNTGCGLLAKYNSAVSLGLYFCKVNLLALINFAASMDS